MSNTGPVARAPMPSAQRLAEPMRSRWSPSIFEDQHVLGADEITAILHAAQCQRVIVITGAASGIGYATAEMFRDAGDIVFGLDI